MRNRSSQLTAGFAMVVATVLGWGATAFAATPESLANDSGVAFRDTGIAIIAVLIPLAVALLLAKKALPWARRMLHV